ncbi:MAG: hypothetical protein NC131_20975, partial [Roseburia sp.]|nr:hypothetical protein [Roseburia sp.]
MKITLKKGLNLNIAGAVPQGSTPAPVHTHVVAICPDDFPGFQPKAAVSAGDAVQRGTALLFDKRHPQVKLISPVAGKVREVVRGDRRKIIRVEVEVSDVDDAQIFEAAESGEAFRTLLAESGLLAMMRQRPYDIVPAPDATVRDIFVTAYRTAPLDHDVDVPSAPEVKTAAKAVSALAAITSGKVYISHSADGQWPEVPGAEMVAVAGPHPAGNAGVQIANIKPVNKGETVWTLDWDVLLRIGRLLESGKVDTSVTVAVTGPEVEMPSLVTTVAGAQIAPIVAGRLKDDGRHKRIISGNVLTGTAVGSGEDAFLRAPYRQITVIAEG